MMWRRHLGHGLFAAAGVVLLGAVGYSVAQVFENYDRAPFFDMITVESYLANRVLAGHIDLIAAASIRINEHRPVLPMVFWIIDHAWLHSSGLLPIMVSLACMAGAAALVGLLALRSAGPRLPRLLLLLAAPLALFWPAHTENLLWPMQILEMMAIVAGLAGLTLLGRADALRASGARGMLAPAAAAVACLFAALFSFGYGLIAWVIAGPFMLRRRWPPALLVPLLLLWAAGLGLYASTFDFTSGADTGRWAESPLQLIAYILVFLGAPLRYILDALGVPAGMTPPLLAGAIGSAGAVIVLVETLAWSAANDQSPGATARRIAGLIILWALAVAIATGLARAKLGVGQSLSPRYLVMPAIFWLALATAALGWSRNRRWAATLLSLAIGAGMAGILVSYPFWARAMADHALYVRVGAIGAILRVPGADSRYPIYWTDHLAWAVFDDEARRGAGVYRYAWPRWPGRRFDDLFATAPAARCASAIDHVEPAGPGAIAATGWAWDRQDQAAPSWLVVVDGDHRIVGLASAGARRPDVAAALGTGRAMRSGWQGLARLAPTQAADVYAVLGDGTACRLTGNVAG